MGELETIRGERFVKRVGRDRGHVFLAELLLQHITDLCLFSDLFYVLTDL